LRQLSAPAYSQFGNLPVTTAQASVPTEYQAAALGQLRTERDKRLAAARKLAEGGSSQQRRSTSITAVVGSEASKSVLGNDMQDVTFEEVPSASQASTQPSQSIAVAAT
jgi:hypothetical protein